MTHQTTGRRRCFSPDYDYLVKERHYLMIRHNQEATVVVFFFFFFLQVMERTFRTMGLHPTYLEAFKATHEQILTGDGPISLVDRHHLALMVKANLIY